MRPLALAFTLTVTGVLAQPQHANWYFGAGGGITFNTAPPSGLTGGYVYTAEGAASISNASGELLFTTNGVGVFDRTGAVMPNGNGLAGDISTVQSALIVPLLNDPDRYYIFTAPSQMGVYGGQYIGLAYSVVNMTLNSGLGDVETLNVPLVEHITEHLTAIRHANGRDVWVVCHGWNSAVFHAYLVTCTGVHGPVDSEAGSILQQDGGGDFVAAMGSARISPQGDRIALTWTDSNYGTSRLEVHGFDNATGAVSEGTIIEHPGGNQNVLHGYGVAFSPDGTRLYWSEYGLLAGIGYGGLLQFDMTADDIAVSEQIVASDNVAYGTLQLGPDGRLYAARLGGANYLSCVPSPNALAPECGFEGTGVFIAGQCTWGLANDWDTFPEEIPLEPLALSDTVICNGTSFVADATYEMPFGTPTYHWSTGATTPAITITEPGTYTVDVLLSCASLSAGFDVSFRDLAVDLGPDHLLCLGDSLTLETVTTAPHMSWSTGDTMRTTTVRAEGTVLIAAWDEEGCIARDSLFVDVTDCTCPVYVPNAFTPNTDDMNDDLIVRFNCDLRQYKLSVFDRWGGEVFTSQDPMQAWKGEGLPLGVYAWTLIYAWFDGARERKAEKQGHITLIR